MKSIKVLHSAMLATYFLSASQAFADGFSVQHGRPTFKESIALQQYVRMISHYQPETPGLLKRLQDTITYYQKVHILKTVDKKTYTVDCIPFAEQPALIDRPEIAKSLLPEMITHTKKNIASLKQANHNFDFNPATECPLGSIAMLRPSKRMLTSVAANYKTLRHHRRDSSNGLLLSGYTWEQGADADNNDIYILTEANQAYFKRPQNQYSSPNQPDDHSLNQFWLTNSKGIGPTYSVEFGIISSLYFTTDLSTSIFSFASIDNYGSNSCYNLECPNFVQAPGTTPLGVPITNKNVDYIFQVQHSTKPGRVAGYYITLVEHHPGFKQHSSSQLLGYYPDSLYAAANRPRYFSAGAEVYAHHAGDGTLMNGNYANPYAGYIGSKQISLYSENGNYFPSSTSIQPAPYGLVWHFGQ